MNIDLIWPWFIDQLHVNQFMGAGVVTALISGCIIYLKRVPSNLISIFNYFFVTKVTVKNDEYVFRILLKWLSKQNIKTRQLQLYTTWNNNYCTGEALLGNGTHYFFYKGLPVIIRKFAMDSKASLNEKIPEALSLSFYFRRDKTFISTIIKELIIKEEIVEIYSFFQNEWESVSKKPYREFGSVITDHSLKDALISDIDGFLSNKDFYRDIGIPYKRNYLFTGAPGVGKSSLILAIASYLKKDIYSLDISALVPRKLPAALSSVPDGSILLLEDIDGMSETFDVNKSEDPKSRKATDISLSTLLNALDGLNSKEDIFVILTTNHPENINPTILRTGRVDRTFILHTLTRELVGEMYDRFYPIDKSEKEQFLGSLEYPISGANVQELLIEKINT